MCPQLIKEIEVCLKDTRVIRFDKTESCAVGYGTFFTPTPPTAGPVLTSVILWSKLIL